MPRKRLGKKNKRVAPPILNPDAAGIDIGATEIYVAVPADRDPEPIRMFATFTEDLNHLADWLQQCGVRTVAMESTGVISKRSQLQEVFDADDSCGCCGGLTHFLHRQANDVVPVMSLIT